MSFTGEFRHSIDAKGRLIVPSRMRDELSGDQVVLTVWLNECIAMWSAEAWADLERRLRDQNRGDRNAVAFVRRIAASAHPDEVDKQGRITVPLNLRQDAGITKDVVVAGALDHGEIWSPERWEQEKAKGSEGQLEALAEGLRF